MNNVVFPQALTADWLRSKYEDGSVTPAAVIAEIVRRAERDADMNIWITPPSLSEINPYLERLHELDPKLAPLWGIPFAIKDNIDLGGVPTTAACPEYAYTPDKHAPVVERLVAAGAIPIGKTNLDQFATGLVGVRSPYGETHNALRPELISGGSSSGSAVAVARGQAVFALGTDTAGSGRVPAALNGLVGFKPSLGAWPVKGVVPACASLDCVTVFAHNLQDAQAADRAARGIEGDDPWSRPVPAPAPKLPARLCLPAGPLSFFGPFAEEYRLTWEMSVERLLKLNVPVDYVDMRLFEEAAELLYEGPWIAERWAALGDFIESRPGTANEVTERILRSGASEAYGAASVFQAIHKLQHCKLKARRLLQEAVLALPTSGGTWSREQVRRDPIGTNRDMGRYTNHCNLLDLCAVAVPSGEAAPLTPFGITLFALSDNEGAALGLADAYLRRAASKPMTQIAVCGLHMRGFPLEKQMKECGARFLHEDTTAAKYRLFKLPTVPEKPGLVKRQHDGASIQLEVWEMPFDQFGLFAASIPSPLGIGKVELQDGSEIPGFICEGYAELTAEDVTAYGGWRNIPGIRK